VANIKEGLWRIQRVLAWYGFSTFTAGVIVMLINYDHTRITSGPWPLYLGYFLALTWGPYLLFTVVYWITRGFLDIDDD